MTRPAETVESDVKEEAPMEWRPDEIAVPVEMESVPFERPSRARRPARRSSSTTALLAIGVLIASSGIGFAIGHMTGGSSTSGTNSANGLPNGGNGGQFADASGRPDFPGGLGGGGGGAAITGTVVSVTNDSMTLKLANGSTITIGLGSTTTYHGQTSAAQTDVKTGATVSVKTSGGQVQPDASASASTGTATDVTITGQ